MNSHMNSFNQINNNMNIMNCMNNMNNMNNINNMNNFSNMNIFNNMNNNNNNNNINNIKNMNNFNNMNFFKNMNNNNNMNNMNNMYNMNNPSNMNNNNIMNNINNMSNMCNMNNANYIPNNMNLMNSMFNMNNFGNYNNDKLQLNEKIPKILGKKDISKISYQMENCICYIKCNYDNYYQGFFCKFIYHNKIYRVLITQYIGMKEGTNKKDYHISLIYRKEKEKEKEKEIKIYLENRQIFLSEEYNISIIEIKCTDNIDYFIFFDYDNSNLSLNEQIYTINGNEVDLGIIKCFNQNNEIFLLFSDKLFQQDFSFPIFDFKDNKLIAIYKDNLNSVNKGIVLKFLIDEYIKIYNINVFQYKNFNYNIVDKNKFNQIKLKLDIKKDDIGKDIYFLNNFGNDKNYYNDEIQNLDENYVDLYINNVKMEYKNYFRPLKEGDYFIKLTFKIYLKNCFAMFYNCDRITEIDLSCLGTKK